MELKAKPCNNDHDEDIRDQTSQDTWTIVGGILGTEDRRTDDTAPNKSGRCQSSFPLSSNVVSET